MKFLHHIRSKSKVKEKQDGHPRGAFVQRYFHGGKDVSDRLPLAALQNILAQVCSLTLDDTYDSTEESVVDYSCALCDVKDLAQCSLVSRKWWMVVRELMYRNVRIEPVHYCEREYELAEKRKHKSFFERNADPTDAPRDRLVLLMRTLRENPTLASKVRSLRLPYMTRESCKAELARTVAVLPHLRYVDVPEGFYSDDVSSTALKHELQISCPEVRRMKYNVGSERSLMQLPGQQVWKNLEILELCGLRFNTDHLADALGSFPWLQDLKFVDLPWLENSIFRVSPQKPQPFPSVKHLTIQNAPRIDAQGLVAHLSQPQNREKLTQLSLSSTGVKPQDLHHILAKAPCLVSLSILDAVEEAFPSDPPAPLLTSRSLKHLRYEITSAQSPRFGGRPPTDSYYAYLASSLLAQPPLLPNLMNLYVRDLHLADTLVLTPPSRPFAPGRPTVNLSQPLSVFSKGLNEMEWNFTSIATRDVSRHSRKASGSAGRPISLMGAESLSSSWGGGARKDVVVGNGLGGFLSIPTEEEARPVSRGSISTVASGAQLKDLWR